MSSNETCNQTENYIGISQSTFFVSYYIIVPIYICLGLPGHFMALLVFYKEYKTQKAYTYQLVYAINDIILLFTKIVYSVCLQLGSGIAQGGFLWFRSNYVLMWVAAHLSLPVTDMFSYISVLLALSIAADRIFAMAKPFVYKAINHKVHQIVACIFCFLISVSCTVSDSLLYRIQKTGDYYSLIYNEDYSNGALANFVWHTRNFVMSICVLGLISCNHVLIYLYRKRSKKVKTITSTTAAKEAKMKSQETTLIVVTVSQSFLKFISSGALVSVYTAMLFSPTFLICDCLMFCSLLDITQMIADLLEFYLVLVICKQFRKLVLEAMPCFKKSETEESPQVRSNGANNS